VPETLAGVVIVPMLEDPGITQAIVILGALTFFPILVLGPIAEAFQLNAYI
jgi:K+-transporting ATPase A subunit